MNDWMLDLEIARKCPADWKKMQGDDKVRYCNRCNLNVYNLSALTKDEAVSLVQETEGRLCARLFRRKDGTVLTSDCPLGERLMIVGTAKLHNDLVWVSSILALVCMVLFGKDYVTDRLNTAISSAFSKVISRLDTTGSVAAPTSYQNLTKP